MRGNKITSDWNACQRGGILYLSHYCMYYASISTLSRLYIAVLTIYAFIFMRAVVK